MFEALTITLREGVEGALVLAIALAFLRRRGLAHLRPALWAGTAAALACSVALAIWAMRLTYNQELAEGIAMLAGFVLVISLVIWMWKAGPGMKEEVESGLARAMAGGGATAVFLFAFGMVLREGAETAIFLSAASFNSEGLALWLGAAAGLALAVSFGVLFVRGSLRVPLGPFFSLTSAVLLLIAIQLLVGGLHELSEAEILPASRQEMALIGPLVKNELLVFMLTVAVVAIWLLRRPPTPAPTSTPAAGPEARLVRAEQLRESRRLRWTGVIGLAVVGLLAVAFARGSRTPAKEPASPVALEGDVVRLAAMPLSDGHMHFFEATLPAGSARFFAIRIGDRVQVCLDACEICGDKGYYEQGSALVCRNCISPIARPTVGRPGGCNPIPIPHREVAGAGGPAIEIRASDLATALPQMRGR